MGLAKTIRGKDLIMVVVDRYNKNNHFVSCHKMDNDALNADLFLMEIVKLCRNPRCTIF